MVIGVVCDLTALFGHTANHCGIGVHIGTYHKECSPSPILLQAVKDPLVTEVRGPSSKVRAIIGLEGSTAFMAA